MTDTYADTHTGIRTDIRTDGRGEVRDPAALTSEYSAHNYSPLPVMASSAEGVWVTDSAGRRYLDMLAGYSALNFGHRHPRLVAPAMRPPERGALGSPAVGPHPVGPSW